MRSPQGQRPALHQRKYGVPPDVEAASSSGGTQQSMYPTIVNPAMYSMQTTSQPSAPSTVAQDWEITDKYDSLDKKVHSYS